MRTRRILHRKRKRWTFYRALGAGIFIIALLSVASEFIWPPLASSTDGEGQPEISVIEGKLGELPQQEAPPTSFEEAKEVIAQQQEVPPIESATPKNKLPTETDFAQLPASVNLDIPFFSQAPDGDWSLPRKDACEEASITLAAYYLNGISPDVTRFKEDILALVSLQNEMFGDYIDTDLAQTAELFDAYYGQWKTLIIDNPTVNDIKYWLSKGDPIVAPFAGRELGNSHFTNGGPRYHMLVIRGYDETYFYTNDVWTRFWNNFPYTYDILLNAMHDLTDGDITKGEKRMLVILKYQ